MASPSSSDLRRPALGLASALRGLLALVALGVAVSVAGYVTVRPEEREYLADPTMTFGTDGTALGQEEHVLSNREGAYGGGSVTGGGCGCN